jgi:lipopolysaccharide export system protein LptA
MKSKIRAAVAFPYIFPHVKACALALACGALLALALPSTSHAEKADKNKPMVIDADALRHDDLKQTGVYTGNVIITKGTLTIRGERIVVRQDPEGYQFGLATAAPGKLAFFRQKREGLDEWIEGVAESIEYDGKADTVKFVKQAVLKRFKGTTLNDETIGSTITYDNGTDVFTVEGGASPGAGSTGGRIRTMMTPKDANAPAAPGAVATPAATPTATPVRPTPAPLRPSTQLGGAAK